MSPNESYDGYDDHDDFDDSEDDDDRMELTRPLPFIRGWPDVFQFFWMFVIIIFAFLTVREVDDGFAFLRLLNGCFHIVYMFVIMCRGLVRRPTKEDILAVNENIKFWFKVRVSIAVTLFLLGLVLSRCFVFSYLLLTAVVIGTVLDWRRADEQSVFFIEWYEKREREEVRTNYTPSPPFNLAGTTRIKKRICRDEVSMLREEIQKYKEEVQKLREWRNVDNVDDINDVD